MPFASQQYARNVAPLSRFQLWKTQRLASPRSSIFKLTALGKPWSFSPSKPFQINLRGEPLANHIAIAQPHTVWQHDFAIKLTIPSSLPFHIFVAMQYRVYGQEEARKTRRHHKNPEVDASSASDVGKRYMYPVLYDHQGHRADRLTSVTSRNQHVHDASLACTDATTRDRRH